MITTGTNDHFYRVPAVSRTYLDVRGDRRLAWIPHYNHGLTERGDEMVFEFLDHHLRPDAGPAFDEVVEPSISGRDGRLVVTFSGRGPREVESAAAVFSYGPPGNWVGRLWAAAPARLAGRAYEAEIPVLDPGLELGWYASVTDVTGAFIGTDVRFVTPREAGVAAATADSVDAEGCIFGDFEPRDIVYLQRAGQKVAPSDASAANTGTQSLRLVAEGKDLEFSTDYLRWCPAFPAELCASVRGSGGRVELAVLGDVDSKPVEYSAAGETGKTWRTLRVPVPARGARASGTLRFEVRVPAGHTVWLDTVTFRPVPSR